MNLSSLKGASAHFEARVQRLREEAKGVLLVGVGGPTAVGKSTLARLFVRAGSAHALKVRVLEGDRWLIPGYRRVAGARFPEDVYDLPALRGAVAALDEGRPFGAPFYEKEGRSTGRISVRGLHSGRSLPADVEARCRPLQSKVSSRLGADELTGDVYEEIEPEGEIWIFDSELALFDPALRCRYDLSYGLRGSREVRKRHFVTAVRNGERYAQLTEDEAAEKIEGFFKTDDVLIEPSVDEADHVVVVDA